MQVLHQATSLFLRMRSVSCFFAVLLAIPDLSVSSNTNSTHTLQEERHLIPVLKSRNTLCTTIDPNVSGTCLDKAECALLGGTVIGTCALFGSCCQVLRTCSESTQLKVSYFVNPKMVDSDCAYRIDLINRDVCQIRLDFESFSLAQPTKGGPSLIEAHLCKIDRFTVVTPTAADNVGFDALCGEINGQHIYFPVDSLKGTTSIFLKFTLADRTVNTGLLPPTWRIRATQLECASSAYNYPSLASTLTSLGQQHSLKFTQPSNDFYRLAPPGCLQYYTERSGTYMSFNINGGAGPYLGLMHYAICFRRYNDVCAIRHTSTVFELDYDSSNSMIECDSQTSSDYLFIPNGVVRGTTAQQRDKYCQTMLNSTVSVTSNAPGPLFVYFNSDARRSLQHTQIKGFSINYQLLNNCNIVVPP